MRNINTLRIPTLFALFLLLIVIGVSIFLIRQGIFYVGKAAPDPTPQNILITNITDTSFTVAFTTTLNTEAVVDVTQGLKNQSLILDDRDKSTGVQKKYYSHHITVPNLSPNKKYEFTILSGGKEYGVKNNYSATTGSVINTPPPSQNPLYGTILLVDSSPGEDVLVIVKNSQSQTVSAITSSKGSFIIPVNSLRVITLDAYSLLTPASEFTITAFRETYSSTITASYALAQSLPPITLAQQYNFLQTQEDVTNVASELKIPISVPSITRLSIQVPTESQSFIDNKPQFRGTAYPNADVAITIKNFIQTTIKADQNGAWSYRSDNALSPDTHEFSVRSPDNTGKITQITRSFVVFPAGSQIAESATPSATPTIQPTSTPKPSPTPIISQGVTPTISVTPTTEITPTPTIAVTKTVTIAPTKNVSPTPLPSLSPGGTSSTIILSILSIVFIIAGTGLLFIL